ncbi:ssDNA endodeoxyribonuclease SAE2 SCDLUD_001407 [Saccharomycodes ludwigii]|uniref:ssDNA endodeoxyribonuclease SAE2 n=1 Tax=Saccharomycodes ludwigii TaxID=36035 RepID=UPI001E8625A8|nr:hypothetical protein SCDLUD_001407 [Saccharomycodes ludwigii]KAH3901640.1 hypothetical protein SCDLUD_001407 [Saccharomycodes ludwigii]
MSRNEISTNTNRLKSGLNFLLDCNIQKLLDIQFDVNFLLEKRINKVLQQNLQLKKYHTSKLSFVDHGNYTGVSSLKHKDIKDTKQEALKRREEEEEEEEEEGLLYDSEELISTQLTPPLKKSRNNKSLYNQGVHVHNTSDIVMPKKDGVNNDNNVYKSESQDSEIKSTQETLSFSSPLKFGESLEISNGCHSKNGIIDNDLDEIHKNLTNRFQEDNFYFDANSSEFFNKPKIQNYCRERTNVLKNSSPEPSKPINKPSRKQTIYDLNYNPRTKKPWILEDFKENPHFKKLNGYNKDRKGNYILEKLDDLVKGVVTKDDRMQYNFPNLRCRSDSPPGYGRMDFPTTQEDIDDREEANKILFNKTKGRLLWALNEQIPWEEREFHFRSNRLNKIAQYGNFHYQENNLQIFQRPSRKRTGKRKG